MNICLMESQKEEREKGVERIFEEIMLENFPNFVKMNINLYIQEAQNTTGRIHTYTHPDQCWKPITKEKFWRQEERHDSSCTYDPQEDDNSMIRNHGGQKATEGHSQNAQRIVYPTKLYFKSEGEIIDTLG